MSGKGNCHEFKAVRARGLTDPVDLSKAQNAAAETFFKTIKAELIGRRSWETRRQAETAIFQYINGFYNSRRRHSASGGKTPLALERQAA
jgi:transposase InsO family protein